jgi:hypothetical protein
MEDCRLTLVGVEADTIVTWIRDRWCLSAKQRELSGFLA